MPLGWNKEISLLVLLLAAVDLVAEGKARMTKRKSTMAQGKRRKQPQPEIERQKKRPNVLPRLCSVMVCLDKMPHTGQVYPLNLDFREQERSEATLVKVKVLLRLSWIVQGEGEIACIRVLSLGTEIIRNNHSCLVCSGGK
jgi:hypothetical protein